MADEDTKDAPKTPEAQLAAVVKPLQMMAQLKARVAQIVQDLPKTPDAGAANPLDMSEDVKAKVVQMTRERLAGDLLPAMKDPRTRNRTVVAMKVLGIVEREIGRGEGPLPEEWAKLREAVQDNPEAVEMVNQFETAIRTYADDLDRKVKAGEVDAEMARASALKMIRMVLLKKIQVGRSDVAPETR